MSSWTVMRKIHCHFQVDCHQKADIKYDLTQKGIWGQKPVLISHASTLCKIWQLGVFKLLTYRRMVSKPSATFPCQRNVPNQRQKKILPFKDFLIIIFRIVLLEGWNLQDFICSVNLRTHQLDWSVKMNISYALKSNKPKTNSKKMNETYEGTSRVNNSILISRCHGLLYIWV